MRLDFEEPITAPVLFMVFNRPDKTEQVFDVIKSVKPKKLYVAADAPRDNVPEDYEKCKKVRSIVSKINWDCDSKFLFHVKNMGCSLAGFVAWDWLFSKEEEMIFLEDDGIPTRSFFYFCQELLRKYKNNYKIGFIGGQNFGNKNGDATYFFTHYGLTTWGFATWKRTFELFEYKMESYRGTKNLNTFKKNYLFHFEYKYRTRQYEHHIKYGRNTYDLQLGYMIHKYDLFCCMPNINMVTSTGYELDATNTIVAPDSKAALKFGNIPRYEINEIRHPEKIEIEKEFEIQQMMHRTFHDKSKAQVMFEVYFRFLARGIRMLMRIGKQIIGRKSLDRDYS
ncbi:MAG: hypothetical protein JW786_00860 [Desulfobacterales bacterium]|nr:hypothetical protein [Desulfobacterales bacterium]